MKKIIFLLILIIVSQTIFTGYQMRHADNVSASDMRQAVKAHNIEYWIGE